MRLSALIYFYARRVRTRPAQELLAGTGIALGVALMFAVLLANSSITGSAQEISRSITGPATLQLSARGADGFDEGLLARVRRLPGVKRAASVLALPATLSGPRGSTATVQLASAGLDLALLDGLSTMVPLSAAVAPGVMLPSTAAHALGISTTVGHAIEGPAPRVTLDLRGRATSLPVTAILGADTIGPLSGAMAAFAPLSLIQRLAALPGRVTRILVESAPAAEARVRGELEQLAAGRLTVAPANQEVTLLAQALRPNAQATGFFALVSGLVGLLLAFNAMLLTAPERRRTLADLRIQGVRRWQLVQMQLFQALCLGVAASLVGLLAGAALARDVFHETPDYLAVAFPLGSQTVIGLQPLLLSFVGGVAATCLAAAPPLLDLRRRRAMDAVYLGEGEPGHTLDARARLWLLAGGVALILATSGLLLFTSSAAIVAIIGLAFGALLAIPFGFTVLLELAELLAVRSPRFNTLLIASRALRATTVRSLALAATGAIAIFGSVAAEGAHNDLLGGLYRDYAHYVASADLWVTSRGDDLATMDFPARGLPARIASLPGVADVRSYQGGYLDVDGRRVWIIARPTGAKALIPAGQIVEGNPATAAARLQAGGWIAVSAQLAAASHVKPGDRLTLPTPTGLIALRVAATTTNLGWSAGAIVLNDADYRRAWASSDPSALEVDVHPGANLSSVRAQIEHTLGRGTALQVQTSAQRAATADALARQGLERLTQISLLLIVVAALAMAAAMGAAIWQRRPMLASLRIQSFQPSQLRSVLIYETGLVLGIGCLVGTAAGIYGHLLMDRYLRLTTGFPTSLSPQGFQAIEVVLLVLAAALLVLAGPGYIASRTPPVLALETR